MFCRPGRRCETSSASAVSSRSLEHNVILSFTTRRPVVKSIGAVVNDTDIAGFDGFMDHNVRLCNLCQLMLLIFTSAFAFSERS